jgi:hypothetical protein
MLPQNSDPFSPSDYTQTFTILDGVPGITPIPNYAALPTNLTSAQHGSKYLQLDNGAEWYWYKPTSGSGGSWKRSNSVGMLAQTFVPGEVDTFATGTYSGPDSGVTPVTIATITGTVPGGGRPIGIFAHIRELWTTGGNGSPWLSIFMGINLNGSYVRRYAAPNGFNELGDSRALVYWTSSLVAGSTFTCSLNGWALSNYGMGLLGFRGISLAAVEF